LGEKGGKTFSTSGGLIALRGKGKGKKKKPLLFWRKGSEEKHDLGRKVGIGEKPFF